MSTLVEHKDDIDFHLYSDGGKLKVKISIKGIRFHELIKGDWNYMDAVDNKLPVLPPGRQMDYALLVNLIHIWDVKSITFRGDSFTVEREDNIPWIPILKDICKYLDRYLKLRVGEHAQK